VDTYTDDQIIQILTDINFLPEYIISPKIEYLVNEINISYYDDFMGFDITLNNQTINIIADKLGISYDKSQNKLRDKINQIYRLKYGLTCPDLFNALAHVNDELFKSDYISSKYDKRFYPVEYIQLEMYHAVLYSKNHNTAISYYDLIIDFLKPIIDNSNTDIFFNISQNESYYEVKIISDKLELNYSNVNTKCDRQFFLNTIEIFCAKHIINKLNLKFKQKLFDVKLDIYADLFNYIGHTADINKYIVKDISEHKQFQKDTKLVAIDNGEIFCVKTFDNQYNKCYDFDSFIKIILTGFIYFKLKKRVIIKYRKLREGYGFIIYENNNIIFKKIVKTDDLIIETILQYISDILDFEQ